MRSITLLVLFVSLSLSHTMAQQRWSVDPTFRNIRGPSNPAAPLHDQIQAHNHVGDTLYMRWRKTVKADPPAVWGVNFANPEFNSPDISGIDSLDFILPDSGEWVTNKFVIGVDPNDSTGYGEYIFTIFEIGHEADSIRIAYYVDVFPGIGLEEERITHSLYPNPTEGRLFLFNGNKDLQDLTLVNSSGLPQEFAIREGDPDPYLDLGDLPPGVYYLTYRVGRDYYSHKIILK